MTYPRFRGYGSVGRASRSQCEGQGFESPYLHHMSLKCTKISSFDEVFVFKKSIRSVDSHNKVVARPCRVNPWHARADAKKRTTCLQGLRMTKATKAYMPRRLRYYGSGSRPLPTNRTSALPKASTSFTLATNNSQDCLLNASCLISTICHSNAQRSRLLTRFLFL